MNQQAQPPATPGDEGAGKPAPQAPARFLFIVGVLMVMIVALLAGLWLRARIRATTAEFAAAQLQDRNDKLEALLGRILLGGAIQPKVARDSLQTKPVRIDGREVTALRLPAAMAKTWGFEPGDVILADRAAAAATTTATQPR